MLFRKCNIFHYPNVLSVYFDGFFSGSMISFQESPKLEALNRELFFVLDARYGQVWLSS